MRVLHVTPHLPPDQAANALLPWQLGNWFRDAAATSSTWRTRRARPAPRRSRARSHGSPRGSSSPLERLPVAGSLLASPPPPTTLAPAIARADVVHAHSNGLLAELTVLLARRAGKPVS